MAQQMVTNFNGILLFRRDYRERDMLIKFLTAEYGKKMFFIRGARRRGFKMAAELLPFTMGNTLVIYVIKVSRILIVSSQYSILNILVKTLL